MIINGRRLARRRESVLRDKAWRFIKLNRRRPALLAIELSDDPGSKLYLKLKKAAAARIGIAFRHSTFNIQHSTFAKFDGIFVQHPPGYDKKEWQKLADQIPPEKDVDCLTTENLELVKQGKPRFLPATVKAVLYCLESLERSDLAVRQGRTLKYVILGRSPILGLPLFWYLDSFGAKVDVIHSKTDIKNQKSKIKNADIVISAIGKPNYVTGDMVKNGVIAIDCGSPVGDIDFESVKQKAAAITPVPGGIGPLTVVSLMENVVESAYLADREGS